MQKMRWFGVVRGHSRSWAMSAYDFLFDFNRNYVSILYRFRDIAGYLSKVADFDPPHLHITSVFTLQSYQSTRGHGYKIYLPGCRTDARKNFFALRVIHPWNSFKLTPASMSSLCRFKALLRNAELSRFLHCP